MVTDHIGRWNSVSREDRGRQSGPFVTIPPQTVNLTVPSEPNRTQSYCTQGAQTVISITNRCSGQHMWLPLPVTPELVLLQGE